MSNFDIGLRQGRAVCQFKREHRLDFIAEGLPIILESARGFWAAARQLGDRPRESNVLENHAEEEASKILILMDVVRCPEKLCASRIGPMFNWFYDHLARLIYSKATCWKPVDVSQLRDYVDSTRKSHSLEGYVGEDIMPNWEIFSRESTLYADIERYESGDHGWSAPTAVIAPRSFPELAPGALEVAEAMAALGLFTPQGVRATAKVYGALEFKDTQGFSDTRRLTKQLLTSIVEHNLATEAAEQNHAWTLYNNWQLPMYNLDFRMIEVPLSELQEAREAQMAAEFGDYESHYITEQAAR